MDEHHCIMLLAARFALHRALGNIRAHNALCVDGDFWLPMAIMNAEETIAWKYKLDSSVHAAMREVDTLCCNLEASGDSLADDVLALLPSYIDLHVGGYFEKEMALQTLERLADAHAPRGHFAPYGALMACSVALNAPLSALIAFSDLLEKIVCQAFADITPQEAQCWALAYAPLCARRRRFDPLVLLWLFLARGGYLSQEQVMQCLAEMPFIEMNLKWTHLAEAPIFKGMEMISDIPYRSLDRLYDNDAELFKTLTGRDLEWARELEDWFARFGEAARAAALLSILRLANNRKIDHNMFAAFVSQIGIQAIDNAADAILWIFANPERQKPLKWFFLRPLNFSRIVDAVLFSKERVGKARAYEALTAVVQAWRAHCPPESVGAIEKHELRYMEDIYMQNIRDDAISGSFREHMKAIENIVEGNERVAEIILKTLSGHDASAQSALATFRLAELVIETLYDSTFLQNANYSACDNLAK